MYGKQSPYVSFVDTSVYKELSVLQKGGKNANLKILRLAKNAKNVKFSKSTEDFLPIGGSGDLG